MRVKFLGAAALVAALGVFLPGSALSNVNIHEHADGVSEFDSRSGKVTPTSAQRAHAKRLKARVTWSQFGTPATLTRHGKFLARGVRGKTAVIEGDRLGEPLLLRMLLRDPVEHERVVRLRLQQFQ